jgi:broad specificity phosphatase PhoE
MIIDIIFIRHGLSKGNVLQQQLYGTHFFIRDPELAIKGIQRSRYLYPQLKDAINTFFNNNPYTINASCLLRSQETAFYMLAEFTNKPINVIPYICEFGFTLDNIPLPKISQYKILESRNPKIVANLKNGLCFEESYEKKADWPDFVNWAKQNPEFFNLGPDGIFRAVIFSHSHFLQDIFWLKTLENNNGIKVQINTEINWTILYPSFEKIEF